MAAWRLALASTISALLVLVVGASLAFADPAVTVNMTEFKFDPSAITVRAGEKVVFTLVNAGQFPHDLRVEGQGVAAEAVAGDGNIAGGQTATFETTFTQTGTYQFWCPVGNHRDRGMVGMITVVDASSPTSLPRSGDGSVMLVAGMLAAGAVLFGTGALLKRRAG